MASHTVAADFHPSYTIKRLYELADEALGIGCTFRYQIVSDRLRGRLLISADGTDDAENKAARVASVAAQKGLIHFQTAVYATEFSPEGLLLRLGQIVTVEHCPEYGLAVIVGRTWPNTYKIEFDDPNKFYGSMHRFDHELDIAPATNQVTIE